MGKDSNVIFVDFTTKRSVLKKPKKPANKAAETSTSTPFISQKFREMIYCQFCGLHFSLSSAERVGQGIICCGCRGYISDSTLSADY